MSDEVIKKYKADCNDKLEEYEKLKQAMKLLRRDLKEYIEEHDLYNEMTQMKKKLKQMKDTVIEDPKIKETKEKIKELKERFDLLKEMIKIELIETKSVEVKIKNKKLKLVYVLKEVQEESD